ncbi:MAG TPA: PD-(D/E)XK nuclease family protein, partial [Usitatibacteraceae bacterium]|nr:PD-(D/E)XK nuclease family protein [Usitatibacteraceae bacterium]
MEPSFAPIGREALFDRLALGHAGRLTVLTPNRRLAQALSRAFDDSRARAGLVAWESADIVAWSGFVERLWDESLHAPHGGSLPLLLDPEEERALWESVVGDSRQAKELLSATGPAAQCGEAWQLLHAWRLGPAAASADANEDAKAFHEWAARYERLTRDQRFVEAARLPDLLVPFVRDGSLRLPATLVLYAFDLLAPQARDLVDAFAAAGVEVLACDAPRHEGHAVRESLATPGDEIAAAARWARARLHEAATRPDAAAPRIGVVVPDLARSRAVVERVFAATLHPGHNAPGGVRAPRAFGLSLGMPLSGFAIVNDALLVLALAGREIAFEEASRFLRSPFLAGATVEMAARARLDAALRKRAGVALTLDRLAGLVAAKGMPRAPVLGNLLAGLAEFRRSNLFGMRTPSDWAKAFAQALRLAGFPGDRSLDSAEFQTLGKWHEVVAAFARLERVAGRMGYREA